MDLTFLGAARVVTGSKFLLRTRRSRVLVDCGMFQGFKKLRERNWQALPFKPADLDAVVLTHAHLDHCGWLPRLVRQGYRGRIFCTAGTADLAKIVLADAGRIQEEDAERANRKGYTKHRPALPLFTEEDAARAMSLLQPVGYDRPLPVADGVSAEWAVAGHLLGSSSVRVRVEDEDKTILFSGDVGRYGRPVLPDPAPASEADIVLVESTYGDREHAPGDGAAELAAIVNDTVRKGGKVVIPAFALGRVEEILYLIDRLEDAGTIPELPVYVDSPMAVRALAVYRKRLDELDPDLSVPDDAEGGRAAAERRVCGFCTAKLDVVTTIAESRAVQESDRPAIIVSSSGMATGGRVLHHLVRVLPDDRHTVLFSGYQAAGTRGRRLDEGAKTVRIHGREIAVRARIERLDGLSAHADASELMRWLGTMPAPPAVCCLVHGEPDPMDALKARIERELGWSPRTPAHQETITL